jgi:hypothetical protein
MVASRIAVVVATTVVFLARCYTLAWFTPFF